MKKLIMMVAVLLTATQLNAQDYKTGIGMRFGLSNGITARHNIDQYKAIEGILSFRWHGFNLTGLYELQYEDAFKFVKRQQSDRNRLHSLSQYEE